MSDKDHQSGMKQEDSQFQANHASIQQVEKQLLELALFAELNPSPLIRFDAGGTVLMANSAATELFGPGTLEGSSLCDILPAAENIDLQATVRDGMVFTYAAPVGKLFYQFTVRGVPELGIGHIYGSDITEHKRAELALRESEERLSKVFENSNDAIFIIDPDNDSIIEGNLATCKMLGYSREELRSLPISSIHPSEMPKLKTFSRSVFDKGRGWTNELSCMTKAGDMLPTEISASVVNIAGKNCIVAIVRDITERKFVEKTQRELAVLEERNRIARDIHDSIAQSLTGIIWQLNVLDKTVQKGEDATKSIDRVRSLARDALQEARRSVWDLRAGSKQGQALSVTLKDELEKLTGDSGIETQVTVEGNESILPSGIETALLRIYQESMANVLKYSEATRVDVTLKYGDGEVILSVQDNGAGFDTEAPVQPGRNGESGGFGLINMRERARLLGGELKVRSQPGQGTRVEAVLPLKW